MKGAETVTEKKAWDMGSRCQHPVTTMFSRLTGAGRGAHTANCPVLPVSTGRCQSLSGPWWLREGPIDTCLARAQHLSPTSPRLLRAESVERAHHLVVLGQGRVHSQPRRVV